MAKVTLKKGEGRSLSAGGSWINDNEVDKVEGDFTNGDLVKVEAFNGYPFGTGFINTNSKIRIRMMSRKENQAIDDDFIEKRVRDCVNYRKNTIDMQTAVLYLEKPTFCLDSL